MERFLRTAVREEGGIFCPGSEGPLDELVLEDNVGGIETEGSAELVVTWHAREESCAWTCGDTFSCNGV